MALLLRGDGGQVDQGPGGVVLQPGRGRHLERLLQLGPPALVAVLQPSRAGVGQGVGERLLVTRARILVRNGRPIDLVPFDAGAPFPVKFYAGFYLQPAKTGPECPNAWWPTTRRDPACDLSEPP